MLLALPAIASNITIPLLGLCDTAITGHLGRTEYLAAIAAGSTMLNVILWLCGFLRMGTTGLAATALGQRDRTAQSVVLLRAIAIAAIIGIGIVICSGPVMSLLLTLISPSADSAPYAAEYFTICSRGIPPLLVTLSINGWLIGMQNTVIPMAVSISMNVINVAGSLIAVFLLKQGLMGVAYGTLTANWLSLVIAIALLAWFIRGKGFKFHISDILRGGGFRKFFNVSLELFLRSTCIMAVSTAVTSCGARMGDLTLAANAVTMQFFFFFSYVMDGFAFAGEALTGESSGAADGATLRRSIRALLIWSAGVACMFLLIYLCGARSIINLLTDIPAVRETCHSLLTVILLIPVVSFAAFILDGFFIGFTATRRMLFTTLAASLVFAAVIISAPLSNMFLWTAFLLYLFSRGVGLSLQLPALLKKYPVSPD